MIIATAVGIVSNTLSSILTSAALSVYLVALPKVCVVTDGHILICQVSTMEVVQDPALWKVKQFAAIVGLV